MIHPEDLAAAVKTANPLFAELQSLYHSLPDTQCCCDQPGVCCIFLPQMTLIEALQWFEIIQQLAEEARFDTLKRFMNFYLTNPVRHSGCPFLQHNTCGIYEFRPFACRAYGLWSRETGDERTDLSRRERKVLLNSWKRFGLELPAEMVGFEIDYCDRVQCRSRPAISDSELIDILEKVYRLDQNFPELQNIFEEKYHSDFSFLIASLILGVRKSVLGKFAVIKEMVNQGSSKRLQTMLARVTKEVLDASLSLAGSIRPAR
jgi:Fe-S-cluster containining protein